jgi:hypothetical protein
MYGNQETAFLRDVKISHRHSDHMSNPFLTSAIFGEGGHDFSTGDLVTLRAAE